MRTIGAAASALERRQPGLLAALPPADWGLLAAGAVVFGAGQLVPPYTNSYKSWYPTLRKPDWHPPPWVFPTVWIPLKVLQSAALWLVWKGGKGDRNKLALPLAVFGLHLFLGNWWNVVFFGRRELKPSVKWMGAFWTSVAGTIASFYNVEPVAAYLMAPTQVWVSIAALLNYEIVRLNTVRD
ncbi:hypothetical protein WJX81_003406 [Elliptochloris bilobata]|uniref:Tryptophan-rich sensory protein n=1 Tax=Elliptochloris bilobata TaxID=381761 RepID=A0AAW1SH16_9CHLO